MNIFWLDDNFDKCAEYHVDKHCVKQILEYSQLLCGAHSFFGNQSPYKLTHKNHPCSIWVRESLQNYNILLKLAKSLLVEYTRRYGKTHKCGEVIRWCEENVPPLPTITATKPPLCMPENVKLGETVISYRNYYNTEKRHLFAWKHGKVPLWIV